MRRPSLVLALVPASLLVLAAPPARAASWVITNLNDQGIGSFRRAVEDHAPGDTIRFAPGLTGEIVNQGNPWQFLRPVTIVGPGASVLALSGDHFRSLILVTNGEFRISGLTLRNARGDFGSAIASGDTTRISRCTFTGNRGTLGGGAVRGYAGVLEVTECTFENNVSDAGSGAAIQSIAYTTITGSTFRGNDGGAVEAGATLLLMNCTFSGNENSEGGAVRCFGSPQAIIDCTISGNTAYTYGGGVYANGSFPQFLNTIVAGNSGWHPDVSGTMVSLGHNLIGSTTGATGFGGPGLHDQVGAPGNPLDPNLAPIGDYGGPTWTMPPRPFSPAIDQGNSGASFDQRGRPRFYDNPNVLNATGGDASDVGAYEVRPGLRTVTTLADAGAGSLRQALVDIHPYDADSIKFAANVRGTITLTSGPLNCAKPGVIDGPGAWDLALHGNNASRVIVVPTGNSFEVRNITLTGGRDFDGIAAIGYGNLYLRRCRIVGNHQAPGDFALGGVVREMPPASLLLDECTIANNTSGFGGGVFAGFGTEFGGFVTILNCTISGNTGPGVTSTGATTAILNSTITNNNTAGFDGGGIWHLQGPSLLLGGTLVAGNLGPADVSGVFATQGYNLVGKVGGAAGLVNGVNHDRVGTVGTPLAPGIGPLQANGGPGETHALLPGSAAIDKGRMFRPLDQRGAARYDDPAVTNEFDGSDIGAYERNPQSVVAVEPGALEAGVALSAPRPNPAVGGVTAFATELARSSEVTLAVYNAAGRRVRILVAETRPAGAYRDAWDGRDDAGRAVTAGVYFARLVAGGQAASRSFVVLP